MSRRTYSAYEGVNAIIDRTSAGGRLGTLSISNAKGAHSSNT